MNKLKLFATGHRGTRHHFSGASKRPTPNLQIEVGEPRLHLECRIKESPCAATVDRYLRRLAAGRCFKIGYKISGQSLTE